MNLEDLDLSPKSVDFEIVRLQIGRFSPSLQSGFNSHCPSLRTIWIIRTVRTAQRTGRLGIIFLILEKRMLIRMRLKKNLFQ